MASLVAYDDSGSDISDSDEEQVQANHSKESSEQVQANHSKDSSENNHDNDLKEETLQTTNIFQALPTPKVSNITKNIVEEDDEFLHKKETPSEVPSSILPVVKDPVKKTTKIFLPSLSSFNDEEDTSRPMTKFKQSSAKGTGLLNLLPKPRLVQLSEQTKKTSTTSLIPDSVKNKINSKPAVSKSASKVEKKKSALPLAKYDSSGESDAESNEDIDFFSLNKAPEVLPVIDVPMVTDEVATSQPNNIAIDVHNPGVPEYSMEECNYVADATTQQSYETAQSSSLNIDEEALQKLAGSRAKRKGEVMQIIDIDQKEIMPDPREWLTKALTEDTTKRTSASKRRGDEPTMQQKRKHQITYLAHQAKANEQELQNQWANNRLSKRQTQSKYGF